MGRGKEWTPAESLHLAQAWVARSEGIAAERVLGTNQTEEQFWHGVKEILATKAPTPLPPGTYHQREWSALKVHWRDGISREVKKFRKSLLKVYNRRLSGCSEQDKINIAVVIHRGISDVPDYRYVTYDPQNWKYYECWQFLKSHSAFVFTPPPSTAIAPEPASTMATSSASSAVGASSGTAGISSVASIVDETQESQDDDIIGDGAKSTPSSRNETPVPQELFTPTGSIPGYCIGSSSRGPGPGAKKTKLNAEEDEFKKKKIKLNQEIVSAIKERQITYSRFVRTQEKSTTFRDAALGYRTFKDSDPAEAQKYKEIMLRCVVKEGTMDQEEEEVQEGTDE